MKFFISLIPICLFILKFAQAGLCSCYTGFACSIDRLEKEQQKQTDNIIEAINNLFKKEINEKIFFSKADEKTEYKDLFIYKYYILF